MRILITGASGFVAPHLFVALKKMVGNGLSLSLTAKDECRHATLGSIRKLDICDKNAVEKFVLDYQPTHIVHLAGIAAITAAHTDPTLAWRVHLDGTRNLAQAILNFSPECALIYVGSGQVYGESANCGRPLDEAALLAPLDDYAASKAAADLALGAMAYHGLKCVRLRPFNHTGSGQTEAFVVPAFASQIARIEAGLAPNELRVGNLEALRDFLDVRDVARAYALVVLNSETLDHGEILNIASGQATSIHMILDSLVAMSQVEINIERDASKLRPSDLPIIVGNADRAGRLLGWTPEHELKETLAMVLEDCRASVAGKP